MKPQLPARIRVLKPEGGGVQMQPALACQRRRRTIERIPKDGMTDGAEVHPQLMGATRQGPQLQAAAGTAGGGSKQPPVGAAGLASRIRAAKALSSREHPWCFFPEKTLRRFLLLEID